MLFPLYVVCTPGLFLMFCICLGLGCVCVCVCLGVFGCVWDVCLYVCVSMCVSLCVVEVLTHNHVHASSLCILCV
jgi:hypothetical protein